MIWSVLFVDHTAAQAADACVARIDGQDGNAAHRRFVGDEGAKLSERPVVQACSLTTAGRDPASDMRQVLWKDELRSYQPMR